MKQTYFEPSRISAGVYNRTRVHVLRTILIQDGHVPTRPTGGCLSWRRPSIWARNSGPKWSVLHESHLDKDADRRVVVAAQSIANIVKSSLGPLGLDKMLVDNIGVRACISSQRKRLVSDGFWVFRKLLFQMTVLPSWVCWRSSILLGASL